MEHASNGANSSGLVIYRRIVILYGAHAVINPMARDWGVVITGTIGKERLHLLEAYPTRRLAQERRSKISEQRLAICESIEQVLYPFGFVPSSFIPSMYLSQIERRPHLRA
jgi:hypothetical protein